MVNIRELTKIYGSGEERVIALDGISFDINGGECAAILGKSGSGKSTLLNLVGGIDKADKGEILIDNRNILDFSQKDLILYRRRDVGFVYQSFNLISVLNVMENILVPIKLDNRKCDGEYFDTLIQGLEIDNLLDRMPGQLSGGQKQRVAIARAMICKPKLVLADEPTGNLDSETSEEVMKLLMSCREKFSQTILLVTHDLHISEYADRVITLKDGKII